MIVTSEQLQAITPNAVPFLGGINAACERYEINTPARAAAFLGQFAHETEGFRFMSELWGPTPQQRKYDPPGAVAARLGNTRPGDGRLFRGRGFCMLTGRANYTEYSRARYGDLRLLSTPDLVAGHDLAPDVGGWYWATRDLNALADAGDFKRITLKINGGLIGLASREKWWETCKTALKQPGEEQVA